jgi:four helix bundle protein
MEREQREQREQRERIDSFEQMKVWQEAHSLVLRVFEVTPKLPTEQQEGLALQMERTAVEIPKSIAEGFKRRGSRNKAHYYNLAQSALESLRYYFILCRDLKYDIEYDDLSYRGDQVARMLDGLVRSMTRPRSEGRGRGRGRGRRRDESAPDSDTDDDRDDYDDEE